MDNNKVIANFNAKCAPFYIVDHDDGTFSLCYSFSFCDEKYRFYGQEAFDKYAEKLGEPARDEHGYCTHGNGHEWSIVFHKYFEDDPIISRVVTDCEAGGFYCYGKNLADLVEYGIRFKSLIDDTYTFEKVVSSALNEDRFKQQVEQDYKKTMHYFLDNAPLADVILKTSAGEFLIEEDVCKSIRDGKQDCLYIGDYEMTAEDFGALDIESKYYDKNTRAYRIEAEIPELSQDEGMGGM